MELRGLGYVGVNATNVDAWAAVGGRRVRPPSPSTGRPARPTPRPAPATTSSTPTRGARGAPGRRRRVRVRGLGARRPRVVRRGGRVGGGLRGVGEGARRPGPRRPRRARASARFEDPFGNTHELFWDPHTDEFAFASPTGVSGFLTERGRDGPRALRGAVVRGGDRLLDACARLQAHRPVRVGTERRRRSCGPRRAITASRSSICRCRAGTGSTT